MVGRELWVTGEPAWGDGGFWRKKPLPRSSIEVWDEALVELLLEVDRQVSRKV